MENTGGKIMVTKEDVEKALDKTRTYLRGDGGDVQLIDVTEDGVVKVKLQGACGGCPMATITLKNMIEKIVKQDVPGVKAVESV
jgi:Fe-S cluster biogenesis protein NfuA